MRIKGFFTRRVVASVCMLGMTAAPPRALAADNVTASINLSVPALVRVYGIGNLPLGTYTGAPEGVTANDNVCVWSNQSSGNYKVTARGSGQEDAFTLGNGSGGILPYEVRWNNSTSTVGNVALTKGVQSSTFSIASRPPSVCSGSENANFQVLISRTELLKVAAGAYSGVLTLVISP
jgi:hypothetical protein